MKINYLPQDNEARINNGICRYDGFPYFINLTSQTQVTLRPLNSKSKMKQIVVNVNDEKFDVSSPPLGWLNHSGYAYYLLRRPERNYKQSLSLRSVWAYNTDGNMIDHFSLEAMVFSASGESMFLGEYPKLYTALNFFNNEKNISIAISRNICLVRQPNGIKVLYKQEEVGLLDPATMTVKIPKAELAWIASKYLEGYDWRVE